MSTTAERLTYPLARTLDKGDPAWEAAAAARMADELKAENLVLASREDVRLAVEVAYRETYGDLETPLNDATRIEIDQLATAVFTELERSA